MKLQWALVYWLCLCIPLVQLSAQTATTATILKQHSSSMPVERFTLQEFRYAGQQLFTPDGELPLRQTSLRPVPTIIMGAALGGLVAGLHIYQAQTIWEETAAFHIQEDGDIELGTDKGGHFTGAYFSSKLAADLFMQSGLSWNTAVLCGSLAGFGYQLYVEILDGYGKNWGFSPSDVVFNTLGAGFYFSRHYSPFLQNFTPKAEFYPAPWFGEKTRKYASSIIDDYSAWTWWLSVNVYGLLPESWQRWYPSWLNIAVGYAARNLDWDDADRKIIIGLDYNLEKILPEGGSFWNWLRQYVNMLKLPAPAVEFSPTRPPRFVLLYPFRL